MIEELAFGKILKGARGGVACDVASLVDALMRVTALICRHPEIREGDVNPVIVDASGAVAVDARIILEPPAA